MIRPWSEDNPTTKSSSRTRRFGDLARSILKTHFVWYNVSRSGYLPKFHEMLRLPRKVTLQLHQILPLRRRNRHLASESLLVPSWRRILDGKIQRFALRLSPKIWRNAPATKSVLLYTLRSPKLWAIWLLSYSPLSYSALSYSSLSYSALSCIYSYTALKSWT